MSRRRRGTVLLMIVGLLAMLFMIISAYITLARFDRLSLVQADKGAKIEQVLDGVNDVLIGAIAKTWSNNAGDVYFGGARYADVPGGLGMEWLASNNPVRTSGTPSIARPMHYTYPAVTSLAGSATRVSVQNLMFDSPGPLLSGAQDVDSDSRTSLDVWPQPNNDDAVYNALRSFMDADGDGIADSLFSANALVSNPAGISLLTEMANAMDGRAVRTNGVNMAGVALADLPTGGGTTSSSLAAAQARAWQNFQLNARYLAAARVISHGGMASIALPATANAEELLRVQRLYTWMRNGGDYSKPDVTPAQLNNAWAARDAIEPLLRMRGGLLLGAQSAGHVPQALTDLMNAYKATFVPYDTKGGNQRPAGIDKSQRFNLARSDDWDCWRHAACFDAEQPVASSTAFTTRQWLTTVNLSDELARDQTTSLPQVASDLVTIQRPGIVAGQSKFYLGRIANAFSGTQFDDTAGGAGFRIIDELAGYYNEMLYDYDPNDFPASDRLLQAYMLAVNTVAFAAPRNNGQIDVVYRDYTDPNGVMTRLVGYAPQPFITQAVAYNDYDDTSVEDKAEIALAIELYYPHEPGSWTGQFGTPALDPYVLDLSQFFLTLNDNSVTDSDNRILLSSPDRYLSGRNFLVVAVNDGGSNTAFDNATGTYTPNVNSNAVVDTKAVADSTTGEAIEIKLWRLSLNNQAVQVDKLQLDVPTKSSNKVNWLASSSRDTHGMADGGLSWYDDGHSGREARWRVVVEDLARAATVTGLQADRDLDLRRNEVGWPAPSATNARVPAVPLYTMNANLGTTLLNGMWRPNSFPTVGFLLFVPRYAHVFDVVGGTWTPVSERLADESERYVDPITQDLDPNYVPCDFGHMPVFDNTQQVSTTSDFDDTKGVGQVPWGQFVFDYFTTLNPDGPDGTPNSGDEVDPYRVPGRININTASWYALAGLPVIGPNSNDIGADLPFGGTNACPAFWSGNSGVLAGYSADGFIPRRFRNTSAERRLEWDPTSRMWRLGYELGRAAAAYRDGMPYPCPVSDPLLLTVASERNDVTNANAVYRGTGVADKHGTMRGKTHPGFLTIGELAHVVGFDSATNAQLGGSGLSRSVVDDGDFMKAVGLIALLDSNYVTTRSNVFTAYTTLLVLDPEDSQASIRSQVTVDRTNLLPRVAFSPTTGAPLFEWKDLDNDGGVGTGEIVPMRIQSTGQPEIIGRRQVAYFNTRYED